MRAFVRKMVVVAGVAAALCGGTAQASEGSGGTVYFISVTVDGLVFFYQNGPRSTQPSCSSGQPKRWVFSGATPAGQAMLATLLSASATGAPVAVTGSNACNVVGDVEGGAWITTAMAAGS